MATQFLWFILCLFIFISGEGFSKHSKTLHKKKHKTSLKQPLSNASKEAPLPLFPQQVILTFDDGPDLVKTPQVLDLLDLYGYKAIFFVNGVHFESNINAKKLLQEIVRRGHFIGNHTIHHDVRLCKRDESKIRDEIERNAKMIEEVIGYSPFFFRAPYGNLCKKVKDILAEFHISHTGWDVDPQDWKRRDPQKNLVAIQQELATLRGQRKPLIILLHDIHKETVKTLPSLFAWFQTQPYLQVVHPLRLFPEPPLLPLGQEVFLLVQQGIHVLETQLRLFL